MMTYHCMNQNCEATFRMELTKSCPFCGGKMLRHAMGYEIDGMKADTADKQDHTPLTILWTPAVSVAV